MAGRIARPRRVWLITNAASGSAGARALAALEEALGAHELTLVGRTLFPDAPLPDPAALDATQVDTVILLARDGTINAASRALAEWRGRLLVLPGGTMNMLAKALHGEAIPAAIVAAAAERGKPVALPVLLADGHCAFVRLIVGPGATWSSVREAVRRGRWRGLPRAVAHA